MVYFATTRRCGEAVKVNETLIKIIEDVPEELFDTRSLGCVHSLNYFRALKAYRSGHKENAKALIVKSTDILVEWSKKRGQVRVEKERLEKYMPRIELFSAILNDDDFDKAYASSIRDHQTYWNKARGRSRGDSPLCLDPEGYTSVVLSGLKSLSGMQSIVESDYVPKWLSK